MLATQVAAGVLGGTGEPEQVFGQPKPRTSHTPHWVSMLLMRGPLGPQMNSELPLPPTQVSAAGHSPSVAHGAVVVTLQDPVWSVHAPS